MRIIAFLTDSARVDKIINHLYAILGTFERLGSFLIRQKPPPPSFDIS
jgi:hypothetical protein